MSPYLTIYIAVLIRHPRRALTIAWWFLIGKTMRARGKLVAAATGMSFSHRMWLKLNQPDEGRVAPSHRDLSTAVSSGPQAPFFTIHIHVPARFDGRVVRSAIQSVRSQSLPDWQIVVTSQDDNARCWLDPADPRTTILPGSFASRMDGMTATLGGTQATFLIPLEYGCKLTTGALRAYRLAVSEAVSTPLPVLYADQDEQGAFKRRSKPWFKPQWDVDLFLSQDYLSVACAIPVEAARPHAAIDLACADEEAVFLLLARILLKDGNAVAVVHVPYIAVTCPPDRWRRAGDGRAKILQALLGAPGPDAYELTGCHFETRLFGTLSVRHPPSSCGVSIIIPTRDKVDLLRTCLSRLLAVTDYAKFEVIIIDNGSVERSTLDYFREVGRDPRVRVLEWQHEYNYSAINNFAAAQAREPYLCLLNNDTEIISAAWLSDLMRQAARPGVGCVGARLLYPDHSIQHAGVVVGMGNAAGHAHRALPEGDPGYFAQAYATRGATAVTAACLVISKYTFDQVGGLDECGLKIAYNDIDLCLKVRAAGLKNIYEPRAVLIHHESKSRGLDFSPEHLDRYMEELRLFQTRWQAVGFADPTHHPALDTSSEVYRPKVMATL